MLSSLEAKAAIEALLFMATEPLQLKEIKKVLDLDAKEIKKYLKEIKDEYEDESKGIELIYISNGYQFQTKAKYESFIKDLHRPEMNNTLTQAALETLAIIAYKQPVTKPEIEDIRGVNVEKALKTLQKRGLVKEKGRKETIGNPILYGTTAEFLQYMGLENLEELPPPKEFAVLSTDKT